MSLNDTQKKTAQAIVNIFETGKALGNYGQVTVLAGDKGQLTYGRSQTTLASGNLYLLIKSYCGTAGAAQAAALSPYLPQLQAKSTALNQDGAFKALLSSAGSDPVMHACQDSFFDQGYWVPAVKAASALSLDLPLSMAVVYDSFVHGSWALVRDRTQASNPGAGQQAWVAAYVAARRNWLATNSNPLLQKCVYRMESFEALIAQGAWDLPLPLTVHGVMLNADVLNGKAGGRVLKLASPMMQGSDVQAVQTALGLGADGIFGPGTAAAVTAFQTSKGLTADGVVGPSTLAALGL